MDSEQIVISGAGPTGLALAAELRRLGVPSLLLDKQAEGQNTSRAVIVHARTLEVLEPLGAASDMLEQGLHIPAFHMRDRDRLLARIAFDDLPTKYPFVLAIPQDRTEAVLLQHLRALGGEVVRPAEITKITPAANRVDITVADARGEHSLEAAWLVGCDGLHSVVREQAGIGFDGGAYDENFILGDVHMDWPYGPEDASILISTDGVAIVVALPGGHFRIVATVNEARPQPTLEDLQSVLDSRGPVQHRAVIRDVIWSSRFHIQHRVAQQLRKGRILLAGDAAHVHSPAGGQGMNTGVQDAVALAHALQETLRTGRDAPLEAWEQARLKIAREVVSTTDLMTKAAAVKSAAGRLVRNAMLSVVGHVPFLEHAMARKLSELDNR